MIDQNVVRYKKRKLSGLILAAGRLFNEQEWFLAGYIVDQVKMCSNRVDEAIVCFEDLINQRGTLTVKLLREDFNVKDELLGN